MASSKSKNMVLKRFTCDKPCSQSKMCGHLPMELVRFNPKKPLDILFVTEFPGRNEIQAKRFLDAETRHGGPFRTIIRLLEEKYGDNWSYGISGLFKGLVVAEGPKEELTKSQKKKGKKAKRKLTLDLPSLHHCAEQTFAREVQYTNPRVLVILGDYAYNYIFGTKDVPYGIMVENGKLYKNVSIFGEERDVFVSIHPSWHVRQADACAIGALYEVIRRAIDYRLNGIDLSIPNSFKTKLLTDYDDVKHVLVKMRNTPRNVAVDTEDINLNRVYGNDILSIQLSNNGKTGYVIPLNHYESPLKDNKKIRKLLYNFFTKPNSKSTGYVFVNAKYDMHQIFHYCHALEYNAPLLDCSFAEYSLDENWTRLHGFPMGKGHFSLFTMSYKRGFNYYAESEMKESRAYLAHLPLSKWAQYGGADVVAPYNIFNSQKLQAERTDYLQNFIKLNYVFFGHLIRSCTYVEHCGLSIDTSVLNYLYSPDGPFDEAYQEVMDGFFACESVQRVNEQLIKDSTGHTSKGLFGVSRLFKPSRYLHTEKLYFEELGLEKIEDEDDGEGGGTIGKAFQQRYKDAYPEVALLEQYNALNKMKTGFVNPVYKWMSKKSKDKREDFYTDDRVRSTFTYMAVTGRLKASDPNCYVGNTYITVEGRTITFKEFARKNKLKNGDDIDFIFDTPTGPRRAYKFWRYKNQPTLEFTLDTNHTIGCTYKQECYILDKDGIIKVINAEDVKEGDYFLFCGSQSFPEELCFEKKFHSKMKKISSDITWPTKMTPELAYILGSLCADGSKLGFGQYEGNRRIFDYFQYCWEKTFGYKNKHNEGWMTTANGNQTYFYSVYYSTKAMFKFFKHLGHDAKNLNSHNMIVPDSIFKSDKESVRAFIRAYVDSDGWYSDGISRVTICSVSYEVLEQISQLLLKFGVVGYLRKEVGSKKEFKGKEYKRLSYLDISGVMFDRYMYRIGYGKKTVNEPVLSDIRNGGPLCRIPNIIPNIAKETEQLLLFRNSGAKNLNIRRITDTFMDALKIEDKKIYRCLEFVLNTGATPIRVKKIREAGKETVYDVTIERDEDQIPPLRKGNIIVNGMIQLQSQQRPSRGKHTGTILSMYAPKKGRAVVKLDYETFEVKGLGFMSQDPAMIDSFNEMFKLKNQFRENPYIFYEQGRDVEKNLLLKKQEELKERKAKLPALKEFSPKDYAEARSKLEEDIAQFKKEKEKFKDNCKNNKVLFSQAYLKFQTDFHRRSAALFNKCPIEEVSKSMRQNAKSIVFGSIYGRGIDSIAQELKIEKSLAEEYFKLFMANMPQAVQWLTNQAVIGKENLYIESPIGRRRRVWGYIFNNKSIANKMDRLCMNCLAGNTLIDTDKGLVPIKELEGKKFKILIGGKYRDNDGCVYAGKKETVVLSLERGWKIRATEDHKVQVLTPELDFVMKRIGDLTTDDYVCVERHKTIRFPKKHYKIGELNIDKMTPQLAKMLGYLVSEGSTNEERYTTGFSQKNGVIMNDYIDCVDSTFGIRPKRRVSKDRTATCDIYSKNILLLLRSLGFKGRQWERPIPHSILKSTKEDVIEFLRSLFEGDGGLREREIKYETTSPRMAREIQLLLQKLGICSVIYPIPERDIWVKKEKRYSHHKKVWTLRIMGADYKTFIEDIGFISKQKRARQNKNTGTSRMSRIADFIPYINDFADELREVKRNSGQNPQNTWIGVKSFSGRKRIMDDRFERSVEILAGKEMARKIAKIKEKDYYYYKVEKVSRKKKVVDTYDILNVDGGHKYVANGIIVSNSEIQGICSDCNLIATSLLITLIHHHKKMWYQTPIEECWMTTNMIHDAMEAEMPVTDVYYALKTFECLYTNLLVYYIHKAFDYEIKVPLGVDFTVGSTYANTKDWNGSEEHARQLQKWILEECGKRDGCDYSHLYDYAINHPYFKEYEGMAKRVVDEWIATAERITALVAA